MLALVDYNHDTKYAEFSMTSASEISSLPTTQNSGTINTGTFPAVTAGSIAYTTDANFDFYVLNGSLDAWVKVDFD